MASALEFQRVSVVYERDAGRLAALAHVSLDVEPGAFVAVVGPSGCGKTTLLKLAAGLTIPSSGQVLMDGRVVHGPQPNVGMAFQNPTLLPWRTTLGNVLLPLEIAPAYRSTYRRDPRPHVERARSLLAAVGLSGFEEYFPWQLSGGMQQRASLCRALMHEPGLLLLDEPFGALDALSREELWLTLQSLWAARRCTVVLVTHDLREAVFLADAVFVMSARPGSILRRLPVPLPRPRTLEDCFSERFSAMVHDLRRWIRPSGHASDGPVEGPRVGPEPARPGVNPMSVAASRGAPGAPDTWPAEAVIVPPLAPEVVPQPLVHLLEHGQEEA